MKQTHSQALKMPQVLTPAPSETSTTETESFATPREARFLSNRDEIFMIVIPWIGAAATILFWILGRFGIEWNVSSATELLNGLIFLDHIHVCFTLPMILFIPELRRWGKSKTALPSQSWDKGMNPLARIGVIAAALGFLYWILQISPSLSTIRGMATTFFLLELLGPDQHLIAQFRGISLSYNSSLRKTFQMTEIEKQIALRCENIERHLFKLLLTGELLYWIPSIFELDKLDIADFASAEFVGGVMAIIATAGLIVNAAYFPRQEKSRKFAFLTRVVLVPLKMLSPVGGLAVRATHGTEYVVILRRMVKGSAISKSTQRNIFWGIVGISALYLVPYLLTEADFTNFVGIEVQDGLMGWLVLLTFVIRFSHFYMDSMMFRMGDPETRATVGPLLTTKPD